MEIQERRQRELPQPRVELATTVVMFGGAALLLFFATRVAIPMIVAATRIEPVLAWFIAASTFVFFPLILAAVVILRCEDQPKKIPTIRSRLRFQSMNWGDWLWSFAGFAAIGALGAVIAATLRQAWPQQRLGSSFMEMEPPAHARSLLDPGSVGTVLPT